MRNFLIWLLCAFNVTLLVVVLAWHGHSLYAPAKDSPENVKAELRAALTDARLGTVFIKARTHVKNGKFGESSGTGFIVARNNNRTIIATNCHIACNKAWLWVTTYANQQKRIPARVIAADRSIDIAFISIPVQSNTKVLPLLDKNSPKIGEEAVAIGNPLGVRWSVTKGVFSKVNRYDVMMGSINITHQTDADINPGNSGGPLVILRDNEYKVAGMNTFIKSPTGASVGLGFAVPSTFIKQALDAILDGEPVVLPSFGGNVQAVSDLAAEIVGVPDAYLNRQVNGVIVSSTAESGALDKAGIQVGDILLEIGTQRLRFPDYFNHMERRAKLNRSLPVLYLREGTVFKTSIVAQNAWDHNNGQARNEETAQPDGASGTNSATDPLKAFGIKLVDKTNATYRKALGENHPATSPIVIKVRPESPAHYYGFKQGYFLTAIRLEGVTRQEVDTIAEIKNLFAWAASEGINTDRAIFYFTAYGKKDKKVTKKVLAPIAADVNGVPPPSS